MSRNDALDFAERLYARVPTNYRVYDAEQGQPLLAVLRVVGEQVANLRQDLDALWDNFFIETCGEWVVPYIGALLGTNLLAHPVGQSNRLDVRNTIIWRRSKGTPKMLEALARAITEWPTDLAEFFQALGWSQNINHIRASAALTPDLSDPVPLGLLGRAADRFAHAADFKPSHPLDQVRSTSAPGGEGGWATPGRFQIPAIGFFVRRLPTFPVKGATPAAVSPGAPAPADAACFTFDPLFREMPLFGEQSRAPISRAAFGRAPWETFGSDIAVRQFGVLLASDIQPTSVPATTSRVPCTFGGRGAGLTLDTAAGMRLLEARRFRLGGPHFAIGAEWRQDDGTTVMLGVLNTLRAALQDAQAFLLQSTATGPGRLVLTVRTGRPGLGPSGPPPLPASPPGRFPGAIVALRASGAGPLRGADGVYIYLPPAFVTPSDLLTYYVADDGSTYTKPDLNVMSLARASEGQIYPAGVPTASTTPAGSFTTLNRMPGGMRLADPSRYAGAGVLIQLDLFTGAFQPLGAIITTAQAAGGFPDFQVPDPWPAFTYGPGKNALAGTVPEQGLLSVFLRSLSGTAIPPAELIVVNRRGESLLVYLPEVSPAPAEGVRLFVADDGSTYFVPADETARRDALDRQSYAGLRLARAAAGQVLPIAGVWPLQHRRPAAINLCRCERNALLAPDELGIDPELGRFAFAPGDPGIGRGGLTVDYVEAFSDRVGALNYDRRLDPNVAATRFVSRTGDAGSPMARRLAGAPVHASVTEAIAAAVDGDVIEIVDSATYPASAAITLGNPAVKRLTVRAATGQRPCLTFYRAANAPAEASLRVSVPMNLIALNGLLISGGPFLIDGAVAQVHLTACTFAPHVGASGSLITRDTRLDTQAAYLLCRCVIGGLRVGPGVAQLTVADSIIDEQGGIAIQGLAFPGSPPSSPPTGVWPGPAAARVQLERVTVLGRIHCDVLSASECLLNDVALVEDRQAGCVRFTRYEAGSALPRRYQGVPTDAQIAACPPGMRCLAPRFNSRRWGRPDYMQLAVACPPEILAASEHEAEVGAFAGALNALRLSNLDIKLQEFLPAGLSAVIIAET